MCFSISTQKVSLIIILNGTRRDYYSEEAIVGRALNGTKSAVQLIVASQQLYQHDHFLFNSYAAGSSAANAKILGSHSPVHLKRTIKNKPKYRFAIFTRCTFSLFKSTNLSSEYN